MTVPRELPPLHGRAESLRALARALRPAGAVVAVVGPPGIGKTRLCTALLATSPGRSVDLAAVRDRERLVAALAAAFEVDVPASGDLAARLAPVARAASAGLLLFDNAELALAPLADVVDALRAQAPALRVLITSTERPPLSCRILELPPLAPDAALELLLARARAAGLEGPLSRDERAALADIVRQLDGIPLALELAARHASLLRPVELRAQLTSPLALAGGRSARRGRHGTMRAAIARTWAEASAPERRLLAALSVFPSRFSVDAAVALADAGDAAEAIERLDWLRARSLLRVERAPDGQQWLAHFQCVREFAGEALHAGGQRARVVERFVTGHVERARRWRLALARDADGRTLAALRGEADNLHAALELAMDEGHADAAAELAMAIAAAHGRRGSVRVSLEVCERAAALDGAGPTRCELLLALASAAFRSGELRSGEAAARAALEHARRAGDGRLEGAALVALANFFLDAGKLAAARHSCRRAEALHGAAGDPHGAGLAARLLGYVLVVEARGAEALDCWRRALAHLEDAGAAFDRASVLVQYGLASHDDNPVVSRAMIEQGVSLYRQAGDLRLEAWGLAYLAIVQRAAGDHDGALASCERSTEIHRLHTGNRYQLVGSLLGLAATHHARGDLDAAALALREVADLVAAMQSRRFDVPLHVLLAVVSAASGRPDDAAEQLAPARAAASGEQARTLVWIAEGFVALARVRLASDPAAIATGRRAAAARLGARPGGNFAVDHDARLLVDVLRRELARDGRPAAPRLVVAPDASWFRLGEGQRVDIRGRQRLRLLLRCLLDAHGRGAAVARDELVDQGWPGEGMSAESASNRLRNALSTLRSLGLGDALVRDGDGYRLDPALRVERAPV